jgi:tRNA G18 (ribose-2'-O)-methylase SpoU
MTISIDLSDFTKEEVITALNEVRLPYSVALIGSDNYYNAGAVVRTLHSFLGKQLHLVESTKLYKRACMSTYQYEKHNIIHYDNCDDFDSFVERENRNIVVFERRWGMSAQTLPRFKYPENPILVFGSEKFGVPDRYLTKYPVVSIPMLGIQNDLNLACAVGIACYDFVSKFDKAF